MNNHGRRGRRLAGLLLSAVAGVALLVAACGGSGPAAVKSPYDKALAYSQCMRGHGIPAFPDPGSKGIIISTPADHLAQGSPQFVSASKACNHLDPSTPLTVAQVRQLSSGALKNVACVRAHGLPGMPDPVVNAGGVAQALPPGISPLSPLLQSAQRACRKFMPGLPP